MRILHVVPSLDPATGGPPIVAASLAAAQASLGAQCGVVAYEFPQAAANIGQSLRRIPNIQAVAIHYLPPLTPGEKLFARDARKRLLPMAADADLVHLHGVWDPLTYAGAAVAKSAGKPYVLTPHGMLDPWAISQKAAKKKLALALGYRRMLNGAAFLHYLNADEQALAEPLKLTAASQVIANGIFLEELRPLPPRGSFRSARSMDTAPMVLFLGRLHFKKGLDYLADAFAAVAREIAASRLVVAGPDFGAKEEFEKQIQRLGIAGKVDLVGPLYGTQKLAALVDCDCFCLPSRQEGFSLAVTEAMACARPVVISQSCHYPEVEEAGAGIITELQPPAIAKALIQVLSDRPAADRMGIAGRELVEKRFTWPIVARQMLDAYARIVPS